MDLFEFTANKDIYFDVDIFHVTKEINNKFVCNSMKLAIKLLFLPDELYWSYFYI